MRRVDVRTPGGVLLEDVVLNGSADTLGGYSLFLSNQLIEQQKGGGGGVDRHRGGDLAQWNPVQQGPHVLERVDRHADLPDLTGGEGVVGVEPHLGGEVEGHRQAGLPGLEQRLETLVGGGGIAKPSVLAHRPQPAPVHGGVRPARVRKLARHAELGKRFRRPVQSLETVIVIRGGIRGVIHGPV